MSSHDTRGGDQSINLGGKGNIVHGGIHLTLGELDGVDQAHKLVLRTRFEQQVRDFPENAGYQFALGLSYLDLRLYDLAIERFKKALGQGANEANLFYYMALAGIRGRRVQTLMLSEIRQAENLIEAAIQLAPERPHLLTLWAIIRHDYYLRNGLSSSPPSAQELLRRAEACRPAPREMRQLLAHLPVSDALLRRLPRPTRKASEA